MLALTLTRFLGLSPHLERGKAEPSPHEFKSPTSATHSLRPDHPSNPLPLQITDTKQMCCSLSPDTKLLEDSGSV